MKVFELQEKISTINGEKTEIVSNFSSICILTSSVEVEIVELKLQSVWSKDASVKIYQGKDIWTEETLIVFPGIPFSCHADAIADKQIHQKQVKNQFRVKISFIRNIIATFFSLLCRNVCWNWGDCCHSGGR